mgnify:CR=1 FL=1|jgi:hypothetical protein
MLKFQILSQNLKLIEKPSRDIIENQINFLNVNFSFSEEWTEMKKLVQFSQDKDDRKRKDIDYLVNIDLGEENDVTIKMPFGIKAGILKVACYGEIAEEDEDGNKIFVKKAETNIYSIPIAETGIDDDDLESTIEGDKFFLFKQMESKDEWIINHKLKKYPSVSIIDSAGTNVTGEVTYLDENSLRINFSSIMSGKAFLN